jgi:alpha-beta hydrolase superfamily lysophospholipase
LGGSVGVLVALGVLAETDLPVAAVALVSPAIRLAGVVAALVFALVQGPDAGWGSPGILAAATAGLVPLGCLPWGRGHRQVALGASGLPVFQPTG